MTTKRPITNAMPVVTNRYRIPFDEDKLSFPEEFPEIELEGVITTIEFDSVIRKINGDMADPIRQGRKRVRQWSIASLGTVIVVVGFFITPVAILRAERQKRALIQYWDAIRAYFAKINGERYLGRNLEWKLVKDEEKGERKDAFNPLLLYRIELIHRIPQGRPTSSAEESSLHESSITVESLFISDSEPSSESVHYHDFAEIQKPSSILNK